MSERIDTAELRPAAEMAADCVSDDWYYEVCTSAQDRRHPVNVLIGECSPDVVLGLLNHIDELSRLLRLSCELSRGGNRLSHDEQEQILALLEKGPTR